MTLYIKMGASGCCDNGSCVEKTGDTCPNGQSTCESVGESCENNRNEPFGNHKLSELTHLRGGYFSANGEFVNATDSSFETVEKSHPLSNWLHQENVSSSGKKVKHGPVYVYDKIVKQYGKPDVIANQPRGICIWYIEQKDGDVHHSIVLKDEYVGHCVPAQHNDFLYSYVKVYIPPEKIKNVLAVSGSVGYDGLQKLLYARCASIAANMATIASVFLVLNNKDPNYVNQIKKRYPKLENNVDYITDQLRKNQNKYRKQIEAPYSDLAFPNGCK